MKIQHTIIIIIYFFSLAFITTGHSQGCVAIRQFSTGNGGLSNGSLLQRGEWQVGSNYRFFKSFRHFRGRHEEPERVEQNTEVINHSHSLDFFASYAISNRFFATLTLPFVYNERSSLYEHGRTERHSTYSSGLGDVRIGGAFWVLAPERHTAGNLSIGLGLKLPTGDYAATDIFQNVGPDGGPEERPVDQSIQPGDGGWGIFLDLQYFQQLAPSFFLYANGSYLANPREINGTRTYRETLSPILANEAIMSVPDQYAARLGLSYVTPLPGLGASLGARFEGIPVRDLLGGSSGFRRPGYVLSVEPGLLYSAGPMTLNLNVPIALLRCRPQSVTDKETEMITGKPRNGDAAFADYLLNVGISFRFGHSKMAMEHQGPMWEESKEVKQ